MAAPPAQPPGAPVVTSQPVYAPPVSIPPHTAYHAQAYVQQVSCPLILDFTSMFVELFVEFHDLTSCKVAIIESCCLLPDSVFVNGDDHSL